MNPENKGWAIGNTPELACAHNSHAIPQARKKTDKNAGVSTGRFTGTFDHKPYLHFNGVNSSCAGTILATSLMHGLTSCMTGGQNKEGCFTE